MCDHTGFELIGRARKDRIAGASGLESTDLLQVLAFEMQLRAAGGIDLRVLDHRGAQYTAGDALLGRANVLQRYVRFAHRFHLSLAIPPARSRPRARPRRWFRHDPHRGSRSSAPKSPIWPARSSTIADETHRGCCLPARRSRA